jgi:regulator of sigma E protease
MNFMSIAQLPINAFAFTLLPFLFAILIVVFIHELGHFYVGRLCGVKIEAFSVGFGKEIFGFFDRHGTRWKFCWIPLGGYVRFAGDANAASMPSSDAAHVEGSLHAAALWKRMAIVVAGPMANFLLAIAIYTVAFSIIGIPATKPLVGAVIVDSPAAAAGIRAGDLVTKVDGQPIADFDEIVNAMRFRDARSVNVELLRDGQLIDLNIIPKIMEVDDGNHGKMKVSRIGIAPQKDSFTVNRVSVPQAMMRGVSACSHIITTTLQYIGRIFTGHESANAVSGPIGTAQVVGDVVSSQGGLGLIELIAILSVSIGLFNLFPIPMLDGGHLVFYVIEGILGRPLSAQAQEWSMRLGISILLMLMFFATYNDIGKLVARNFGS